MYVMATVPKQYVKEGRQWLNYFRSQDCHKWIIALEHGSGGLVHWQLRWKQRNLETKETRESFFTNFKRLFPEAHIEFTENWCDYERKEGNFVCSDDTREVLAVRFGTPNNTQKEILDVLRTQGIRTIDVYYDKVGAHGKTWLSLHLFERGQALIVPRYCTTPREISNFVCSAWKGERIIIYDIPRAQRIRKELYETLEEIKDGAVFDPRYSGRMRDIRGVKVLVFCNTLLDTKMLSRDRWRLHGMSGEPLL